MLKLKSTDLMEYTMRFSEQLDVTADQLIRIALELRDKGVIKAVEKLKIASPDRYCFANNEIDLYTTKMRYDREQLPFYLRNKDKDVKK